MKNLIFVAIAFIAVTSTASPLFAQEVAAKTAGYDLKKNVKCRVSSTETGSSLAFEYDVKSPRDVATGQSSGKRGYDYYKATSQFSVSASDNSVSEVKSPRDAASGQATGKRQHKPISITKEMDKSSPKLAEGAIGSSGGSGKVNIQDISFTMRCGGKSTKLSVVDGECIIPTDTCPDGSCSLIVSWSWGMSNSGTTTMGSGGSGRCSVDFLLEIEDGVCTSMAIKEQGLPAKKNPK